MLVDAHAAAILERHPEDLDERVRPSRPAVQTSVCVGIRSPLERTASRPS
jgi:hypothetical protein